MAQDEKNLIIKSISVNKGITYKRGLPVSRGRYHRILKRNSNINVEMGIVELPQKSAKDGSTSDEKEEKKSDEKGEKGEKKEKIPEKIVAKKTVTKTLNPKNT